MMEAQKGDLPLHCLMLDELDGLLLVQVVLLWLEPMFFVTL